MGWFGGSADVDADCSCNNPRCKGEGPLAHRPLQSDEVLWVKCVATGTGIMVAGFQFRGNIPAEEVSTEIRGHFTRNLPGILNFPECNDGIHGVHGLELSMLFCS